MLFEAVGVVGILQEASYCNAEVAGQTSYTVSVVTTQRHQVVHGRSDPVRCAAFLATERRHGSPAMIRAIRVHQSIDAPSTLVLGGHLVKILTWYDNEWGFSNRLVDLAVVMEGRGLWNGQCGGAALAPTRPA